MGREGKIFRKIEIKAMHKHGDAEQCVKKSKWQRNQAYLWICLSCAKLQPQMKVMN